jgi:hypothetical protein
MATQTKSVIGRTEDFSEVFYAVPTLDDIGQLDSMPDPEGYYVGQEERYSGDGEDGDAQDGYDDMDMYEPDVFSYDAF